MLLRRVSACQILYSPHVMSFINNPVGDGNAPFNAEEYTDMNGEGVFSVCLFGLTVVFMFY